MLLIIDCLRTVTARHSKHHGYGERWAAWVLDESVFQVMHNDLNRVNNEWAFIIITNKYSFALRYIHLYRIHFAATMSRCQEVVVWLDSNNVAPSVSWTLRCQFWKYLMSFDTKRPGFRRYNPCSINGLAWFRNRCNALWAASTITSDGKKSKSVCGTQFRQTLNRWLLVFRLNRPKHLAHVCDVMYSSVNLCVNIYIWFNSISIYKWHCLSQLTV